MSLKYRTKSFFLKQKGAQARREKGFYVYPRKECGSSYICSKISSRYIHLCEMI